ncbi:MAG: 2,3-bisphosphoglycerate-independent phosphoglycerate mutase [Anaerolineae bacterium]|nr:2,3-bisphosphoglycerate-independent phosphoglycerate mutase [Anaerolineae bacterium]
MAIKPVMLVILDGWGIREMTDGNATLQANTPHVDNWMRNYERAVIDASEESVGLIAGQMGNSEVGHLNLGAGRVVYQDITRIYNAIHNNELDKVAGIQEAMQNAKKGGKLHLIGLLSDGGVHSHIDHLLALLAISRAENVETVIHIITDGRDTPTNSGIGFVQQIEDTISKHNHSKIATVTGRYYAMDRDKRWQRTHSAYQAMVNHIADKQADSATAAMQQSYAADVTDEFILPTIIGDADGATIEAGDSLLFYNFRADRMRQIVTMFTQPQNVSGVEYKTVDNLFIATMTRYMDGLPVTILFDKDNLNNTLAEVLSKAGKTQYHSAETEKYPHVTFFFNGGRETPFDGETRKIIPSPKDVATYDEKPEMSAYELTEATLQRLREANDDFILINFANPDMVGHTGSLAAAIKAVETVDVCAAKLVEAVVKEGGVALVTADHGNCERMIELSTGAAHTYHTTNPVSLFVIGDGYYTLKPRGKLADVAPTILDLLGLEQPAEMTGESLIDTWVDAKKLSHF